MVTDLSTFLLDNSDRIFRFLVYKRNYTPYEIEQKWRDQSEFTDTFYSYGKIEEAIELPNKDVLLGIRLVYDGELIDRLEYFNLSEIKLYFSEEDSIKEEDNSIEEY